MYATQYTASLSIHMSFSLSFRFWNVYYLLKITLNSALSAILPQLLLYYLNHNYPDLLSIYLFNGHLDPCVTLT
jgi:hypothetical protein